ncbi:recombinase family protein [Arthrobacter sp. TMN-49]
MTALVHARVGDDLIVHILKRLGRSPGHLNLVHELKEGGADVLALDNFRDPDPQDPVGIHVARIFQMNTAHIRPGNLALT